MSSLLKQEIPSKADSPEAFVLSFENNLQNLVHFSEVEILYKKLKFLGLNFDPFNPEVTEDCQNVMESLMITNHLKNPYQATNLLLRLLDKTEERLNSLKQ